MGGQPLADFDLDDEADRTVDAGGVNGGNVIATNKYEGTNIFFFVFSYYIVDFIQLIY